MELTWGYTELSLGLIYGHTGGSYFLEVKLVLNIKSADLLGVVSWNRASQYMQ